MRFHFYQRLSWKLPRKLLYYAVIQAWVLASGEKYTTLTPDEITWGMVCKFLDGK